MSENSSLKKSDDIARMEEILNEAGAKLKPSKDSGLTDNLEKLDYSQPHAEIINTIQSVMQGELADGFSHDNLKDRLYIWLKDYKDLHSSDDFEALVQELKAKFSSAKHIDSSRLDLLFEVLEDLINF